MRGSGLPLLLAGALSLLACSSGNSETKGEGAVTRGQKQGDEPIGIDSADAAKKAVGRRVRIEGTARNAKMSAVVMKGDLVVYCLDRDSWPDDLSGKPVSVQGTLEYTKEFQAKVSPTGEVSQGTGDGIYVLRKSESRP